MAFIITYPFDTPTDYTYNSDKILIDGGKVKLKLIDNLLQSFVQDFLSDVGFTYNSAKAEFVSGLLRQKIYNYPDEVYRARGNSLIAEIYQNSSTINQVGNVIITNKFGHNWFDTSEALSSSSNYFSLDPVSASFGQSGCIRFKVVHNYSGTPSSNRFYFFFGDGSESKVYLYHQSTGTLKTRVYDASGAGFNEFDFGLFSAVQDQEYEFEFNVSTVTNEARLFIDEEQQGTTKTPTITFGAFSGAYIGRYRGDFLIRDFQVFDAVQHTSDFPGEVPRNVWAYIESKIDLPQFNYLGIGVIQAFTNFVSTQTGSAKWIINGQHWDGTIWAASDGSYAQANTPAEILANLSTITATDAINISIVFEDSNTLNSVDNLDFEYTGQIYPVTNDTFETNTSLYLDNIVSNTETKTQSGNDETKYVVKIDNAWYWISGGVATITDGNTYAESNTVAEWEAFYPGWDTTGGVYFKWKGFLHSDDGSTTPAVQEIKVVYNSRGTPSDTVNKCNVYGYSKKPDGSICTDSIVIYLPKESVQYKNNIVIENTRIKVIPSTIDGFWSIKLIDSENMTPNMQYIFEINGKKYYKTVPDASERAFNAL